MKILIAGANSFIGSYYRQYSKFDKIDEICLKKNKLQSINFANYNTVLHLAALVHQKKKIPDKYYFEINKDLAISTALEAKKNGVKHFVFMSTFSVYGNFQKSYTSLNEFSDCRPVNAYGKSKFEAEKELQKLSSPDFIVSVIRPPLIIGENVKANMLTLINLVKKMPLLPFKSVKNRRSFIALENLTKYIDLLIEKKLPGIFIACDSEPLSTTVLVQQIAKNLNKKLILIKLPNIIVKVLGIFKPKLIDSLYGSFVVNNAFTVEVLEYKPVISTEEAIEKMVISYRQNKKIKSCCST